MRFTAQQQDLSDAVGWVVRGLPTNPPVPVLAGAYLDLSGGRLRVSGFDYEQHTAAGVEVPNGGGADDGEVLVAGRLLGDIVKALPSGPVDVRVADGRLRISAGTSRFNVPLMPTEGYPADPHLPEAVGEVDLAAFAAAVRQVSVAASRDPSLAVLTAVQVHADVTTGVLTLSATDRYRLAIRRVPFEPAPGAETSVALVPAKVLDGYARSLTAGRATMGAAANGFSLQTAQRTAMTVVLDGEYPRVAALMPASYTAVATVATRDLQDAVRRVALVAERATPCRLTFDGPSVGVSTGQESEMAASERVDASYDGQPTTIAFNFAYLTDGLKAMESDHVSISMVAPTKPAVLAPVGDPGSSGTAAPEGDYTYLLMPVRVATT